MIASHGSVARPSKVGTSSSSRPMAAMGSTTRICTFIATSGGWDHKGHQWVHLDYLPVCHAAQEVAVASPDDAPTDGEDRGEPSVGRCVLQAISRRVCDERAKGDVPSRYQSLADLFGASMWLSPPISRRRIDRYDGQQVTYHYRSHKSEQVERETVEVYTFIGRMIQHVFPKGFQRIRYYGVQATKTFAKIKARDSRGLGQGQGHRQGRDQNHRTDDLPPALSAEHRARSLALSALSAVTWGSGASGIRPMASSMMSLEAMRRGKHASQAPRAAPARRAGRALWAASGSESLYRCSVCGEEMLVNEAIIDVTIGAATCHGE